MTTHAELDDLRTAIESLRAATHGSPAYTEAVDRLVAAADRAAERLRTQAVDAGEREQLVQLVSDALGVVARAFGHGAEA
jgi:predicted HAD superfamily Cof-like phosphohydrolase